MALFTLEEYKSFASMTTTKEDTSITALLDPIQKIIEDYLGFTLGTDGITQRFLTRQEKVSYVLDSTNLTVTQVTYRNTGALATTDPIVLTDADYFVSDLGILTILSPQTVATTGILDNGILEVTFDQDTDTIPSDLKLAGMQLLRHYLKNDGGRESISINGQTVDFAAATGFPGYIRGILDLHRLL
jgi:hypothetical protein